MNYLAKAELDFNHHKIQDKMNKIITNQNNIIPDDRAIQLNKVDKEVLEILIKAEKKYCTLRAEVVEYSPILSKARFEWQFQRKLAYYKLECFKNFYYIL